MIDNERMKIIINEMEHYLNEIEKIGIKSESDLDYLRFPAISMNLLSLVNKIIDLGEELLAGKKLGMPSTYRDVFVILEKNNLINSSLSKNLQILAKYRNILAHEYGTLYKKDIIFLLTKLRYVKEFERLVKKMI
ncbi:MAG: DUF86 domain-containing protein [Candidatus Aenigmarchaeota archaeon]|nr:DUF86 domain-containing protein [Candidatus Aenigmarchaeota archaeon]